ncbi:MAG: ribosome biogenesis GTPase Der [Bacteroidales bacterium]|nr:ribosome biogenesis GTPase Der [Bacteroidales bacterium]MBR5720785.1 ribosome biogenesis GTPase Der [Bacteroidales bacterium]
MSNILAIVGRPNVGKSTLFNRLVGSRTAIVDSVSGVTRDRHYGKSEWTGYNFSVIDTGGYVIGSDDVFESEISKQVVLAIEEADVILFMVDVNDGLNAMDEDVAALLRKSNKPVIVACNKADSSEKFFQGGDFYALGLGEVFPISAMTGTGTGELLDEIVKHFTKEEEEEDVDLPRFAVVGRPNVGKSSIINAFLGNDRNIVTPVAGTTRDSIYTKYNNFGFEFYLVDTAGVRKKSKINEDIEFYSVMRSIKTIENSDVCILMIDATQGIEAQDLNIFSLIQRNNKGVVIVVNKWDLIEKDSNTHLHYREMVAEKIAPFNDVPIIFTSVLNKQRIYNVIETAIKVYENKTRKIMKSKLNDIMLPIVKETPPPVYKGKTIKIKYITQLNKDYPVFIFFCNLPQYIRDPYKRYVENKLRQNFDFKGVPLTLYFREKI